MFILPYLIGASIGVSLFEGATGADQNRKMARAQMQSIRKQQGLISKHKDELSKMYNTREGFITDEYGNEAKSLLNKVSSNLMDVEENARSMIAKSKIATSPISRQFKLSKDSISRSLRNSQTSMFDSFKADKFELRQAENEELYQADLQLANLEGQYNVAKEQSKDKFLGIF